MENHRLRVETLGPLRAYAAGREITLGPPKQREVFAVLALSADCVVSRDELIDRIWGESPPATAAGSLHTYVSGLRRVLSGLGEPLTSSGSGYVLRLDPERLDLRVVERLTARARADRAEQDPAAAAAALDQALAHWRPGAALSGLPGPFAAQHRRWAAELRLGLLTEHAELLLELGQPAAVAGSLAVHVPENPYHERLRALLMKALWQSGRTADALAQYQELRRLLAEDLGIDPSAELQALHTSILAENARTPLTALPRPVRPAQLPRGVGGFTGRVGSVRQVLDAARTAPADHGPDEAGGRQIVMVVGVGGVGKTALAVHCARLLAPGYPDGQLYLNLRGFDPRQPAGSPVDALHHLLTSVSAQAIPADHEERVALWRSIVRDRSLLIVLDNAESADQVEDLLPGGGPSFTIVTSRNRLSGLAVRYSARRVTLAPFTADESLGLLADSIGPARVGAEPVAARRLADLCGHLPLALRIASEQVTAGPQSRIADLVADLEDVRRRLDALQIPDDELSSVRGVLSWSYARLDAEAAHAFRTLGVFPGASTTAEVAAALLGVPPAAAAAALRSLTAQHLVETTGGRYRMHDLTRIYAGEVGRSGEPTASRRQALQRVLQWYVRILAGEEQRELLARCAQEWENLAPLLRTAPRIGCHEEAWQLAHLLSDHFAAAGRAGEWVDALGIGLRSAESTRNRWARAALLGRLSAALGRTGQHRAAVRQARCALELSEELDDDALRAGLLGDLASALRAAGDHPAAVRHGRRALDLARRAGLTHREAGSLGVLCGLYAERGGFEASLRYGRAGLAAARSCRNVLLEADLLINLGLAEHGLGHAATALRHFEDARSLCESSGDRYHEALALFGLARLRRTGRPRSSAGDLAARALLGLKDLGVAEVDEVTGFLKVLDPASASLRRAG